MRFKFNFFFFGLLLRSSSSLLIYFATLLSLRLWCLVFDLLFLCAPNVTMLMNFPIWRKFSQLILLKKNKALDFTCIEAPVVQMLSFIRLNN